jgi:hypothetical protein
LNGDLTGKNAARQRLEGRNLNRRWLFSWMVLKNGKREAPWSLVSKCLQFPRDVTYESE